MLTTPRESVLPPGRVRVTYVGHASVLVEDGDAALLTDPLLRNRVGHLIRRVPPPAPLPRLDGVLISHLHRDHLDIPSLRRIPPGTPAVVPAAGASLARRAGLAPVPGAEGDVIRLGPFELRAVGADHDGRRAPVGAPVSALGYVIRTSVGGIYFAGDTGLFPGLDEIGDMGLEVALLPVAGWGPRLGAGHLDPVQAADALVSLHPRVAVPIHWGTISLVGRSLPRPDAPHEFAERAASVASSVDVVVLPPGAALELAGGFASNGNAAVGSPA